MEDVINDLHNQVDVLQLRVGAVRDGVGDEFIDEQTRAERSPVISMQFVKRRKRAARAEHGLSFRGRAQLQAYVRCLIQVPHAESRSRPLLRL